MTFFENILVLLLAAILLLQVARRTTLPYPAMLAAGGMGVAFIPGSPQVRLEPDTALALFIAPVLLDAAFDFPIQSAMRFWRALAVLAVFAVLLTTAAVAFLAVRFAHLPPAAAIVLGAIVAPTEAAAAIAILRSVSIPATTATVMKGESLFNDATALLLYGGALAVLEHGGVNPLILLRLVLAIPGGIALGIAFAFLNRAINRFVAGTLGGNVLQFVTTWLVWLVATRLGLSAVLCLVAYGMTLARILDLNASPRMRVHSYAVWATVTFLLNVIAFLIMGMQVRTIVAGMRSTSLSHALVFGLAVTATVIVLRLAVVITLNRLARYETVRGNTPVPLFRQGILLGWSGMRGLVTLATAFALPASFPHRDLAALTAFCVVMGTTVLQGLTLRPLIHALGLDRSEDSARELDTARRTLIETALAALENEADAEAATLRDCYRIRRDDPLAPVELKRHRGIGLAVIGAEREKLRAMLHEHEIDPDTFDALQEELDWRALDLLPHHKRRIEEG